MYATIRINIEVVSYECYDDKLDLAHLRKNDNGSISDVKRLQGSILKYEITV